MNVTPPSTPPTAAPCQPRRLLLVDDSPPFLDAVARLLGLDPRSTIVGRARSGRDALAQVACLGPDAVLLDVCLPDMSGFEVTRQLIARPGAPCVIIIVTLRDSPEYQAAAAAAGAAGFLTKADVGTDLIALLDALCPAPGAPAGSAVPGTSTSGSPRAT